MPNRFFSSATFSGTKEAVHKLIKIGLENAKLQSTGDLMQDFDMLVVEWKAYQSNANSHKPVTAEENPLWELFLDGIPQLSEYDGQWKLVIDTIANDLDYLHKWLVAIKRLVPMIGVRFTACDDNPANKIVGHAEVDGIKDSIVYIDMGNVLVDFQSGLDKVDETTKKGYESHLDDIPGIFALMEPMPGAIDAVQRLAKVYDCYILSTAPWENSSAWSDKLQWVKKYLGDLFYKRLIITHHKNLCHGDYLIDDRGKNGASEFCGWIQFGSPEFPDWKSILEYLNA